MRKKLLKIFNGLFLIGFVILYSSCANTITSEISKIVIIIDGKNLEGDNYRHIHEVFAFSKKTAEAESAKVKDLLHAKTVKVSDDGHYDDRKSNRIIDGKATTDNADLYTTPESMASGSASKYTVTLTLKKRTKIATFIIWGKVTAETPRADDGPAGYVVTFYSGKKKVKTVKIPLDVEDNVYTIHL